MIRLGLCCIFREQPIKFRNTTATALSRRDRADGLVKLSELCLSNADALLASLRFCAEKGIGCFRINSQILPLKTHPTLGYAISDLPDGSEIIRRFEGCGAFARESGLPDVLPSRTSSSCSTPTAGGRGVCRSASWSTRRKWPNGSAPTSSTFTPAARTVTRQKALADLRAEPGPALTAGREARLTIENDDTSYTPVDLIPLCGSTGLPLVYDVHHHRCLPDGLDVEEATRVAVGTWDREPMFHLSSPIDGWRGPRPQRHHDFIDLADFPETWKSLDLTVEVEAKAKELAVLKLRESLEGWVIPAARGRGSRG